MNSINHRSGSKARIRRKRRSSKNNRFAAAQRRSFSLIFLLLALLFLFLFFSTKNCHRHTAIPVVEAWKFRFPRGRKRATTTTASVESDDHGANQGVTSPSSEQAGAASAANKPNKKNAPPPSSESNNNWPSLLYGNVASAAAAADDDSIITEASQAAVASATDPMAAERDGFVPPTIADIGLMDAVKSVYQRLKTIVIYKPPVGLVALLAAARLVVSGRIFRFYYQSFGGTKEDVELLQQRQQEQYRKRERREKHRGRALTLDSDDASYSTFGGVERVRRRLCWAALSSVQLLRSSQHQQLQQEGQNTYTGIIDPQQDLIEATIEALQVTARPTGSRLKFVYEMVGPVARMEQAMANNNNVFANLKKPTPPKKKATGYSSSSKTGDDDECGISPDQLNQLLAISAMTSQVRIIDAVMRICRDRVLQTTYRLARTVEHWERRAKGTRNMKRMFQRLLRSSIEEDRMRLSLAKAAYTAEVERLGEIITVLMERPSGMNETAMIRAVKSTENRNCGGPAIDAGHHLIGQQPTKRAAVGDFLSKWTKPVLSKYSFRWKADGKGMFSIRKYEDKDGYIDGPSALEALLCSNDNDDEDDGWMEQARDWTRNARRVVCKTVREELQGSMFTTGSGSSSSSPSAEYTEQEFAALQEQWCTPITSRKLTDDTNNEQDWKSVIHYVNASPSWRRVGEGKSVKLRDVLGILDLRRLDFLGIPSSLLYVYAASIVHERLVKPHWATIRKEAENLSKKAAEILQQRVWVPMKGKEVRSESFRFAARHNLFLPSLTLL